MKAGATVERTPVEAIAEETAVKTAKKDQLLVQYALDDFITNGVASSEQKDATFSSPTSPPVQSPTPSTLEEELALESLMKNWRRWRRRWRRWSRVHQCVPAAARWVQREQQWDAGIPPALHSHSPPVRFRDTGY